MNMLKVAVIGLFTIGLAACGGESGSSSSTPAFANTSKIQIDVVQGYRDFVSVDNITLHVGTTKSLCAHEFNKDGSDGCAVGQNVIWKSSDTNVATIDEDGHVKAISTGQTEITLKARGFTKSLKVTVDDATVVSIKVTNHYFERLPKGATKSYRAFATYTDGKTQDVTENATWESTDESVATVSKDGIVKAISEGETIIYAEFQGISNDEGLEPRNLKVSGADIVKLEIPKGGEHIKLTAGGEFDYPSIIATYSDGSQMEYGESINLKWQSDDPTVVNTDTFFVLKAMKKGQAKVTASMGNMAVTFDTEVTDAKLTSIEVNGDDETNLAIGSNVHFQATGHYEDGSTGNVTQFVDWSTQGEQHSIYYDDQSKGTVFGALPGHALITASLNGITSDFKIVRVIDKRLSSIEITNPTGAFELKYNSVSDGKLQSFPLGIISHYDDGSQDSQDRYLNVVIGDTDILGAYMYNNGNVSYVTKGIGTTSIMFCTLDKVCTLPMTVNITN